MRFISTRGKTGSVSFSQGVAMGLAPDGGLLLPEKLPDISTHLSEWEGLGYAELCEAFFALFATDIPRDVLHERCQRAYKHFTHVDIAPLVSLSEDLYVLELFHGPTLAFKDFALQLLGELYEEQIARSGNPINVLGATSGDTGAAAIHGLLGKKGVNIFILYPDGRVSPLQECQMTCTEAGNVYAIALEGTFDDCQRIIKKIFGDVDFKQENALSAVNSINLARILAQCVYYIYAWLHLPESRRESVEFVVPTGNFGNVLAGWMAHRMGLPVGGFTVATNQNDILYRLFQDGIYEMGSVHPSHAPSMDIQVASNFERFLYYAVGEDPAEVRRIMAAFLETGVYRFDSLKKDGFSSSRASDAEIEAVIKDVYERYDYVVDPHTACAFKGLKTGVTNVILSTAHPAKFPALIHSAIGREITHPSLEALKEKAPSKSLLRADEATVRAFLEAHI